MFVLYSDSAFAHQPAATLKMLHSIIICSLSTPNKSRQSVMKVLCSTHRDSIDIKGVLRRNITFFTLGKIKYQRVYRIFLTKIWMSLGSGSCLWTAWLDKNAFLKSELRWVQNIGTSSDRNWLIFFIHFTQQCEEGYKWCNPGVRDRLSAQLLQTYIHFTPLQ